MVAGPGGSMSSNWVRSSTWLISIGALVLATSAAEAQVDLTGRWLYGGSYLQITQTGSSATVCMGSFGCLTGSVSSDGTLSFSDGGPTPSFQVIAPLIGTHLDGWVISVSPGRFFATRCQCFDGNFSNGDGCNAQCQIEPCFSCSGDPSTCTPLPDGTACEDGSPCTVGETCSSAQCSGGSPVAPCFDLSGRWFIHTYYPD